MPTCSSSSSAEDTITVATTSSLNEETSGGAGGSGLQASLAELVALSLIGKQLHWNIIRPGFREFHLQLDEFVDAWRELSNVVVERAVAIGFSPDGRAPTIESPSSAGTGLGISSRLSRLRQAALPSSSAGHGGSEHVMNNEVLPPRLPDVSAVDRIVLVARLKAGEREHAAKLLAAGVEPIVPEFVDRWEIFLSANEVVFLFEGEGARESFWQSSTTR